MTVPATTRSALDRLVAGLPTATVLVEAGTIVAFNAAAEVLYQRRAADVLGEGFVDVLFDADDRERIAAAIERALAEPGAPIAPTWRVCRGDGALLVSTFQVEVLDEATIAWIGTDAMDQGLAAQERAVLLSAEHAARAEAEAARFRLHVLSTASRAMTSTLELDVLLGRVADALVPTVADLCVIELIDEAGDFTAIHVGHPDRTFAKQLEETIRLRAIDRDGDGPIAAVLRSGEAVRFDGAATAAAVRSMARNELQAEVYESLGLRATIVAPIMAAGVIRGVLAVSTSERPLHPDDLAMVTEVSHRLSLAIANVGAYAEERGRAETLQRALLPTITDADGLDLAVRYLAASDGAKIGGDWYDVIPAADGKVDVVIGDVVGHDVTAAVGMSQIRNALRAFASASSATPASSLTALNEMVIRLGLDLATAVLGTIDLDAGSFTWSNAGHLPPLLLVDGKARLLDEYLGAMLGLSSSHHRRQATVDLPVGSTLVLYTDGAVEDPGASIDEGLARLVAAVEGAAGAGSEAICDAIVTSTEVSGPRRRDDIAILVVRRR